MDITYLGHASFKLKGKDATLVMDPFADSIGIKFPKIEADIVTLSHEHADHANSSAVAGDPMVLTGPGEYEVKGVSILGFESYHDDSKGEKRGRNTMYVVEIDGVRVAHLGDLGHRLSEKQANEFGEIDVLLIPVGGEYTIGAVDAVATAQEIEAKITVPMHFKQPGLDEKQFGMLDTADKFMSELGLPVETTDKLSVKQGSLPEDYKAAVVLGRK